MKKRVLLLVLTVVVLVFAITSCHKHSFEMGDVVQEATCDAAGQAKYVCSCGEEEIREISANGHTWGEPQVVEPSCYKDGYTYMVCTVCEAESDKTDVVEKSDDYHVYEETYIQEPDCATQTVGEKGWVCKFCKNTDPNRAVQQEMYQHDYKIETVNATCQAPGSTKEICQICGVPGKNEIIPQLEHRQEIIGHEEANCTKPERTEYRCSDCGYEWHDGEGEGLGHLWSNAKVQAPTCTLPGYEYKECTRDNCGEKENLPGSIPPSGHSVDYTIPEFVERKEPTCITAGSITPICTVCKEALTSGTDAYGNPYVQTIDPTDVHFVSDEFVENVKASCHSDEYDVYKCTTDSACVKTTNKYKEGTKLNHNPIFFKTVAPNCLAEGYDLYVCSNCPVDTTENSTCELGCVTHENITSKVDHQEGYQDKVEATCYAKAYENHICPICKTKYTVELDDAQPEHDFSINTNNDVLPTCTSEGYSVFKCKNTGCSETTETNITRRIAHSFEVFNDGRYVCKACNVTYRDISTYIDKAIDEGYMPVSKVEDIVLNASKLEHIFTATEAGAYTIIVDGTLADGETIELQVYDSVSSTWVAVEGAELAEGDQIKVVAVGISADITVSVCKALIWELKGYGNPSEVVSIDANEPTSIFENTGSASMSYGLVKLICNDSDVEYTIVIEYADGTSATYTNEHLVDSNDNSVAGKYLDLYESDNVAKIIVTATKGASYIICANEG